MASQTQGWCVRQIGAVERPEYATIPARFQVSSVLRVVADQSGLGGLRLVEEALERPYVKDYPLEVPPWMEGQELSECGLFLTRDARTNQALGGASVALGGPVFPMGVFQPERLAVLWDLRVRPESRRRGIGSALFRHAAAWASARGYTQLGIETQNVNVAACRFYARQGCRLGAIHRFGYAGCPDVAHEAMLLWFLDL